MTVCRHNISNPTVECVACQMENFPVKLTAEELRQHDLARCLKEQAEAKAYLDAGGEDKRGAMQAIEDWLMEEAIVRGDLRAPFPWFGGKSRVAHIVWDRFGNVPNYVEPFFGSGSVLLARPHAPKIETVNDRDCMVANFWRALQHNPQAVASYADWPVNEADQHARHLWLCSREEFRERMKTDPDYYDAKVAGWWVWGQCIWIGSGWCARQLPHLGDAGTGVHRKLPRLGDAGTGGIASDLTSGTPEREHLLGYLSALAERMRAVRVCCGDWSRVCGPSPTVKQGLTGIFLDPPYASEADRQEGLYSSDDLTVAHAVREWALEWGSDPRTRIALCGYEGEHAMPDNWECVEWKARGGYGSQGSGRGAENRHRERIWFSPHCLNEGPLFRQEAEEWRMHSGHERDIDRRYIRPEAEIESPNPQPEDER